LIVTHAEKAFGDLTIKTGLDELVEFAMSKLWQIVFLVREPANLIRLGGKIKKTNTWVGKEKNPYAGRFVFRRLFKSIHAPTGVCTSGELEIDTDTVIVAGALWNRCIAESTSTIIKSFFRKGNINGTFSIHFYLPAIVGPGAGNATLLADFNLRWNPINLAARYKEAIKSPTFQKLPLYKTQSFFIASAVRTSLKRLLAVMFADTQLHRNNTVRAAVVAKKTIHVLTPGEKSTYNFSAVFGHGKPIPLDPNNVGTRLVKLYFHSNIAELKAALG
jgi:hypothetical protein